MSEIGIYLLNQNSGETFPLKTESENIIGRKIGDEKNTQATIFLPHPAVSEKHTRIYINTKSLWELENLSRNGTQVNGQETQEPVPLQHGDQIDIGPYQLVFYEKFHGNGTVEYKKPDSSSLATQWEDEEATPLGSLLETIAIVFLLALTGFILYCCFS